MNNTAAKGLMIQKLLLGIMACVLPVRAELFVGPTTDQNKLVIRENEALVLTYVSGEVRQIEIGGRVTEIVNNNFVFAFKPLGSDSVISIESEIHDMEHPPIIAVPGELVVSTKVLISYKLLKNSPVRSLVGTPGSTATIDIPDGKTARFLRPLGGLDVEFITNDAVKILGVMGSGGEISGPLKVRPLRTMIISYYITEDFLLLPEFSILQGPTGSFELLVEKSGDLKAWTPVIAQLTSNDAKAFFRLRLRKN